MRYRHLKGYKYELILPVHVPVCGLKNTSHPYIKISGGMLMVRARYAWDGPSGPAIDTKTFMRGSLIHDALYQLIREGYLPLSCRNYADRMLRKICIADGMNKFRAWYVYHSVRIFGAGGALPRIKPRGKIVEILCSKII